MRLSLSLASPSRSRASTTPLTPPTTRSWPVAFAKQPSKGKPEIDWALTKDVSPTWAAMEKLVEQGKTKHIGVSNFTIGRCEKLLKQVRPTRSRVWKDRRRES